MIEDTQQFDKQSLGEGLKFPLDAKTKKIIIDVVSRVGIDHSKLSGLTNDDHAQYILKDGTRAFTGTGDGFKDEDDMASNSNVAIASQQSINAYADNYGLKYLNAIYGDGSDGDYTTSGDYILTADMYFDTLTVSAGDTLTPNGYRIFCKTKLILEATSIIDWSGNDGADAIVDNPNGGAGGAGLVSANLRGSANGGKGGDFNANGDDGVDASVSIGVNGSKGGDGGATLTGGTAGTATASLISPIIYPFCVELAYIANGVNPQLLQSSAGSGGGAGGQSGADNKAGGGGGSAGGVIFIAARRIENAGTIRANGGNGGNGNPAKTPLSTQHGGGGGGGGAGGVIILIRSTYSGAGLKTATGGYGGEKGYADVTNGSDGDDGLDGVVIELSF